MAKKTRKNKLSRKNKQHIIQQEFKFLIPNARYFKFLRILGRLLLKSIFPIFSHTDVTELAIIVKRFP
jgi:hypothetical protein